MNPEVDHPSQSQAMEMHLGVGNFDQRIRTQNFNAYGDQVASRYASMHLRANYQTI